MALHRYGNNAKSYAADILKILLTKLYGKY